jgi:hypothetical protein
MEASSNTLQFGGMSKRSINYNLVGGIIAGVYNMAIDPSIEVLKKI